MRKILLTGAVLAVAAALVVRAAQEAPPVPKPVKEHEWLRQFEGTWDAEVELKMDPAQPAVKSKAVETGRMIGGFWVISVFKGEVAGQPFEGQSQIGYDPEKKKFIGTWLDSMSHHLWHHVGSIDAAGKILTMEARGPASDDPKRITNYKDVHELIDKDTRTLTSSSEGKDGKWKTTLKIKYKRRK